MLFMLFLPKVETTFMKGIYDNIRMLLTFGGAILILFIWIRFVEKAIFIHWFWKEKWMRKYLKGALIGFVFISIPVILLLLMGSVKLQVQHITSTVIVGILGSLVAFLIQGQLKKLLYEVGYSRFFLLEVVYGLE